MNLASETGRITHDYVHQSCLMGFCPLGLGVGSGRWRSSSKAVLGCSCCCSVAKLSPTLRNPLNCSTPGFLVLHYLLEFAQTHVHRVSDAIQPSHPLSSPSLPAPNASQHQGFFPVSQLFTSGGQSIGVSASASVLPMNIQG